MSAFMECSACPIEELEHCSTWFRFWLGFEAVCISKAREANNSPVAPDFLHMVLSCRSVIVFMTEWSWNLYCQAAESHIHHCKSNQQHVPSVDGIWSFWEKKVWVCNVMSTHTWSRFCTVEHSAVKIIFYTSTRHLKKNNSHCMQAPFCSRAQKTFFPQKSLEETLPSEHLPA